MRFAVWLATFPDQPIRLGRGPASRVRPTSVVLTLNANKAIGGRFEERLQEHRLTAEPDMIYCLAYVEPKCVCDRLSMLTTDEDDGRMAYIFQKCFGMFQS